MKKLILIFVITLIGVVFIAAVPASLSFENPMKLSRKSGLNNFMAEKKYQKDFNVKPGGVLTIDLRTGGSISIEGWNKDVVSADVTVKGRDSEEIIVEMEQSGNDVEISSYYDGDDDSYNSNEKVVVKVPNNYNVELNTMGGGVKIYNVNGKMSGKTMGGEIDLKNLKGNLDLSTMGGEISVKDCEVNGKVHTMGGDVLVENVTGDLNAKTMGGKVKQVNVKSSSGSTGSEVNISTMGGPIEVDRALNGAKVKTMGGEITINHAEKFVEAETMGGDIEIKSVDGSIKARTMGGDIEARMIGDPDKGERSVSLTSMGGDITLTVPAGLSMDIEVEIAFTKKYEGDVKIISDFKLNEEVSKEWIKNKGSARKILTGKASVDGGKHKVKINTINGNVYLKKG
ncbi:MAG TPA: hypothetical protein PLZ15_06425 [Melioribacteraceae bacterium]|mgnify:CR=1 FL=1|nr:hypothetical protein [Melioribacteraceae bacterium]